MKNFHQDIDTRITFHELQNDGTQIECNVHTKRGKLFFDGKGELFEPDLLPTIYLVDNRTNCHGLVDEAGDITVKVSLVTLSLIITTFAFSTLEPSAARESSLRTWALSWSTVSSMGGVLPSSDWEEPSWTRTWPPPPSRWWRLQQSRVRPRPVDLPQLRQERLKVNRL